MTAKQTDAGMEFDIGGSLLRRRTELLADGSYLFEDDLAISGVLTNAIITCTAWLIELYTIHDGEVVFKRGKEFIAPLTECFVVSYPPFSITQPRFTNTNGHVFGIAGTKQLPVKFRENPLLFEAPFADKQFDIVEEMLDH